MSVASAASYIWGECTAFVAGAIDWVQPGWGNAFMWPTRANAQGFPIGHTPHIGDVATWQPYQAGAGSVGHVAEVVGISQNSITVKEQNWSGGRGVTDTRTIPAEVASNLTYIRPRGADPNAPSGSGGFLGTGLNLNPLDGISGAVNNFTQVLQKGAVELGLYTGFFLLALVLILMGLAFMVFSTNTGRTAAKGAALAAIK